MNAFPLLHFYGRVVVVESIYTIYLDLTQYGRDRAERGQVPSRDIDYMSLAAVLDAATDDTLLAIALALPTPADLLRLALTCRAAAQRFYFTATSYSSGSAVPSGAGTAAAAAATQQQAETWSIIEEAARQWIATCTDQERGWVPRRGRESWLGLMWEVESLRPQYGARSVA
eukprot:COSAG06_NODE_9529_length_1878_cov_5.018550_2_plen_172_part_00